MVRFCYRSLTLFLGLGFGWPPAKAQYCFLLTDDNLINGITGLELSDVELTTDAGRCFATQSWTGLNVAFNNAQNSGSLQLAPFVDDYRVACHSANTFSGDYDLGYVDIRVLDDEDPEILNCPTERIEVPTDTSTCVFTDLETVFLTLKAVDNCGINGDLGTTFLQTNEKEVKLQNVLGQGVSRTLDFVFSDRSGNYNTCSIEFIGVDKTPPSILCPNPQTVEADSCFGVSGYLPPLPPAISDNCPLQLVEDVEPVDFPAIATPPGADIGVAQNVGTEYEIGTTTIGYKVTDIDGNTDTCNFIVNVVDTQAPNVTCPANTTVPNDPKLCGARVVYRSPVVTDACLDHEEFSINQGSFFPVGNTTVTYTATDRAGNSDEGSRCEMNIEVVDKEAPEISEGGCPPDVSVGNDPGLCKASVEWCSPIAFDNCPGELEFDSRSVTETDVCGIIGKGDKGIRVSSGASFTVGTSTITHGVLDQYGNLNDTCVQQIEVEDIEPPVFTTCPVSMREPAVSRCAREIDYLTPDAVDNCNELEGRVDIELIDGLPPGNEFPLGTTFVRWRATDRAGNEAFCEFNVTIYDDEALIADRIDCDTTGIVALKKNNDQEAIFSPKYTSNGLKDNGCMPNVTLSRPACQLCTYEGGVFDLLSSNECSVDITIDTDDKQQEDGGEAVVANANDIGSFISVEVEVTDTEDRSVKGVCTICVDADGDDEPGCRDDERRTTRRVLLGDDSNNNNINGSGGGKRRDDEDGNNTKSSFRRLKKTDPSSGGGKGKGKGGNGGCYGGSPIPDSLDFLGSTSACGKSGKGGKGSYQFQCPSDWDPLNNQFVCNSHCAEDPILV